MTVESNFISRELVVERWTRGTIKEENCMAGYRFDAFNGILEIEGYLGDPSQVVRLLRESIKEIRTLRIFINKEENTEDYKSGFDAVNPINGKEQHSFGLIDIMTRAKFSLPFAYVNIPLRGNKPQAQGILLEFNRINKEI